MLRKQWIAYSIVAAVTLLIAGILILTLHDLFADTEASAHAYSSKRPLMLYSSLQELQLETIKEGFEQEHPDIELAYYSCGTGKLLTTLLSQHQGQTNSCCKADLVWMIGDSASYKELLDSNLLCEYHSPYEYSLPKVYRQNDPRLITTRLITMGFAYNTLTIEDPPRTWKELAKSGRKIAIADPFNSGTAFHTLDVLSSNPLFGWEYLAELKDSGLEISGGSSSVANQVWLGNYPIGIVPDYIAKSEMLLGKPIDFIYPEDFAVVIPSPIGIMKESKMLEEAMLFVDYILSPEGQAILSSIGKSLDYGQKTSTYVPNLETQHGLDRSELLGQFDALFFK